jgi:hypothetical protein
VSVVPAGIPGARAIRYGLPVIPFFRPAIGDSPFSFGEARVFAAVAHIASYGIALDRARLEHRLTRDGGETAGVVARLIALRVDLSPKDVRGLVESLRHVFAAV